MACNLGANILLNTGLDHSPEGRVLRGLFNQPSNRISAPVVYGDSGWHHSDTFLGSCIIVLTTLSYPLFRQQN